MKICGPKYSLCCTLVSIWGIIQLALTGLMYYVESPAFIEDLSIPEEAEHDAAEFLTAMKESYSTIAKNCGIATAMYVVTLGISGWQVWVNRRLSSTNSS